MVLIRSNLGRPGGAARWKQWGRPSGIPSVRWCCTQRMGSDGSSRRLVKTRKVSAKVEVARGRSVTSIDARQSWARVGQDAAADYDVRKCDPDRGYNNQWRRRVEWEQNLK